MSDLMQLEFERVLKNNNQKLTGQGRLYLIYLKTLILKV